MACRESNDLLNPAVEKVITGDEQRPGSCLDQALEGGVDFAVGTADELQGRKEQQREFFGPEFAAAPFDQATTPTTKDVAAAPVIGVKVQILKASTKTRRGGFREPQGLPIITVALARILAELAWSRNLLERQVVWSRKLLETQMAQSETLFQEQHPQAAAQADTSGTYRGYSYLVGENGVVLKLRVGGLRHFSSEEEAVAYVDSITGRA